MGNMCIEGGANVTCECGNKDDKKNPVQCEVIDNEDGTYTLQWVCTRIGTFKTHVRIDGKPVMSSPGTLQVVSLVPALNKWVWMLSSPA